MPSVLSSIYIALGAFAVASNAACTVTDAPFDKTLRCNEPGAVSRPAVLRKFTSKSKDATYCRDTCLNDDSCKSFSYNSAINRCAVYTARVIDQKFAHSDTSSVRFWSRRCFLKSCTSDEPTTSSTDTPTDPTPPSGGGDDGPAETPADPSQFTATYTFTEGFLPTFTDPPQSLQGVPTETPSPKCFLDATDPSAKFEVINRTGVAIVYQPGNPPRPGLLRLDQLPQSADGMKAYQYPQFHFEKPANAPAGFYDLVLEDPKYGNMYLAREGYGNIFLVNKTSNGQTPKYINNQWVVTTIFGVSCDGKMSVGTTTDTYVWQPQGKFTVANVGTPSDNNTFLILPQAIKSTKIQKRNAYQDGLFPRCVSQPRPLFADAFPGARKPHANGCGSDSTKSFVPNLDFGNCCNNHDLCYDNCKNGFKEQCDDSFQSCMHSSCDDDFPHWWEYPALVGCYKVADFYHWTVASFAGGAFYDANKERCQCYCQDAGTQLCNVNNSPQCVFVKGNDNNNCGACGQKCPTEFSHCSSGGCVCNQDTCGGGLCLSLQDNPRNCGSCGNVCSSRYCYKGHCYDPPPPSPASCTPMDSIVNGGFDTWNVDPFYTTFPPNTYSNSYVASADDGSGPQMYLLSGVGGPATLSQDIIVCPGTNYRLTFTSISYASCTVSANLGNINFLSGQSVKVKQGDSDPLGGNGQTSVYVDPGYADNNGFRKWGASFNTTLSITWSCNRYAAIWADEISLYPV